MNRLNCRALLGKLLLCAGLLFAFAPASHAQSVDNLGGSSFGNFGAGGAYGDFDVQLKPQLGTLQATETSTTHRVLKVTLDAVRTKRTKHQRSRLMAIHSGLVSKLPAIVEWAP